MYMKCIVASGLAMGLLVQSVKAGISLPQMPSGIADSWLAPATSPRVFCTPQRLKDIRATLDQTSWRKAYLARQQKAVAPFVKMTDEQLRALVPPPHSLFIYGLGMNLDPVHHQRMRWGGWAHPHVMYDTKGVAYPNEQWPDKGQGVSDPKTGKKFYFVAQANGQITQQLDKEIFPALADAWALSGDKKYAHIATVLLDAVAAVYPTNRRGPMDYPTSAGDMDRGGRLDRPYYQVARGLMNYGFCIDMIADSGELDAPSSYAKGQSIKDNVIRNLLWDGGSYCLDFALREHALHNGQADYEQGAAVVGALLAVRAFAEPMIDGPTDLQHMLANNIGPDGYYVESSTMYANWTRQLYVHSAELLSAMRRMGWKNVPDPYANAAMVRFLGPEFDRLELSGHVPMIGDAGPDRAVVDPMRRLPVPPRVYNDEFLDGQITGAWLRLAHGIQTREAGQLLCDTYDRQPITPPASPWFERWYVYNLTSKDVHEVERLTPHPGDFDTGSVFYGAKGLALLRGGRGDDRYGAQLLFGAIHNHGQKEALTWTFFARGAEWSLDPGYYNAHFRFGWTHQTVAHQAMVVDQKSVDDGRGSGQLLAWHSDPTVQWTMASQPSAYSDEGVRQYERLIAQVQNEDGKLAYWLDIGRVAGGKTRDDSFHSRMIHASFDTSLVPSGQAAMYGQKDLGRLIRPDGRIEGFEDKGFYWSPPGDGYGFLGSPRETAMSKPVRAVLTDPAWKKDYPKIDEPVMVVDFAAAPHRQFIVADGPTTLGFPSVPYILCRDSGPGASTFAKVIRLVNGQKDDPIASFEPLHVQSSAAENKDYAGPSAWCVTWKSGRRDVWIVADPTRDGSLKVDGQAIPAITTDARVTLVRLDKSGQVVRVIASQASAVNIVGHKQLEGAAALHGRITAINPDASPARFAVKWDQEPPQDVHSGALLRVVSQHSQASSWNIAAISDAAATLQQVKPWLGQSSLKPVQNKPGWYELVTPISQFDDPGGRRNTHYAIGRTVYDNSGPVGRIVELSRDGTQVRLEGINGAPPAGAFEATIMLAAPGDEVIVPLELDAQ